MFSNSARSITDIIGVKPKGKPKEISGELKLPKVMRPDILMEFQNFILHIEIQSSHRERIPERMLLYFIGIQNLQKKEIEKKLRKEKKKVIQVVVWLGKGKPPPSEYKEDDALVHKYEVIDMNEISPDFFFVQETRTIFYLL
jgi:transposase